MRETSLRNSENLVVPAEQITSPQCELWLTAEIKQGSLPGPSTLGKPDSSSSSSPCGKIILFESKIQYFVFTVSQVLQPGTHLLVQTL